jgi:hypothetical protein
MCGISTVQVQVLNVHPLTQGLEVSAQGLGCSESERPALLIVHMTAGPVCMLPCSC